MGRRVLLAVGLAVALMAAIAAPAAHAATDFYSSFESGDPRRRGRTPRRSTRTATRRCRASPAARRPGSPATSRDNVVAVTASGENPPGETTESLVDGDVEQQVAGVRADRLGPARARRAGRGRRLRADLGQRLRRARPAGLDSSRAPTTATTWTTLDTPDRPVLRRALPDQAVRRRQRHGATSYYRLDITANHGGGIIQLAELQLSDGDTTPPPPTDMRAFADRRPGERLRRQAERRLHRPARRCGTPAVTPPTAAATPTTRSSTSTSRSTRDTELSYLIFPELTNGDLGYPSTYAAVDLAFTDGTYLSDLSARDQHGVDAEPAGPGRVQGALRQPVEPQGRRGSARVAAGKTIDRILVGYDNPTGTGTTSAAGSTTSASPAARRRQPRRAPVRLGRSPPAARTPAAASRAATTSRRPPSRTASTSGRR